MLDNKKYKSTYLIAAFAVSFDKFHVRNNKLHLVCSTFLTQNPKFDQIDSAVGYGFIKHVFKIINTSKILAIKSISSNNPKTLEPIQIIEVEKNTFFGIGDEFLENNPILDDDLDLLSILVHHNLKKLELDSSNEDYIVSKDSKYITLFRDSIFIFEDLNFRGLQALFKCKGVALSGGTTTNRSSLSSVEYSLSNYLRIMNYSPTDIYNSQTYFSNSFPTISSKDSFLFAKKVLTDFSLLGQKTISTRLEFIEEQISVVLKEINSITESIINLHSDMLSSCGNEKLLESLDCKIKDLIQQKENYTVKFKYLQQDKKYFEDFLKIMLNSSISDIKSLYSKHSLKDQILTARMSFDNYQKNLLNKNKGVELEQVENDPDFGFMDLNSKNARYKYDNDNYTSSMDYYDSVYGQRRFYSTKVNCAMKLPFLKPVNISKSNIL